MVKKYNIAATGEFWVYLMFFQGFKTLSWAFYFFQQCDQRKTPFADLQFSATALQTSQTALTKRDSHCHTIISLSGDQGNGLANR